MRRFRCLLALALLTPGAVTAQVAGAVPGDTVPGDTVPGDTVPADTAIPLAPIQVTVLRTPLPLTETPYAVTVERPAGPGPGLTLAESLGRVPGLQVDNRYNFSLGDRISVRGQGARAQFGVRGVQVLVDGIPATLPDGQTSLSHVDPRRIQRAEVVRGPASSQWGNAAGGVIQLETGDAPATGATGGATLLVGSHGLSHLGGEAGWGQPGWGVEAAVSRLAYDGFRAYSAADKRFGSARAVWRGAGSTLRVVAHGVSYDADNPGSLPADLLAADPRQAYSGNVAQGTGETARQAEVGVTWVRNFGEPGGDVLEVTGWALRRDVDNPIPPVIIDLGRVAAGVRASVRGALGLGDRTGRWVLGLDAGGQWDDRVNWENNGGERAGRVLDQAETVTSVSPFAEASIPVAGPFSVLAGLRWDRHVFTADDRLFRLAVTTTDDSGSRVMSALSPSLGLTAELGAVSVYGNVASSFETPTTTELVNRPDGGRGFNPELEPQRARSLEVGLRARVAGRIRLNVAAYRMAIRDALVPFEVPTAPGRTYFRNAGSAVHRGLELDAWAGLGAGVSARLGYAWTDARFDRFTTADGDWSGNRVPGVAPHRVTGAVEWVATGLAEGARVSMEGRWVDAVPADDANNAAAPSYTLLDLRAASPALSVAGGELSLFGGVDNVLDESYVAAVTVNAFGGRYYEPGPGRAAYLGVRLGY